MRKFLIILGLVALTSLSAPAKEVLELVTTVRNGQASRVDFLVNSDADLGVFSEVRFSSWGRGMGRDWFMLATDELENLRKFTLKAAADKGTWGVNGTEIGNAGPIQVGLMSSPGGNNFFDHCLHL